MGHIRYVISFSTYKNSSRIKGNHKFYNFFHYEVIVIWLYALRYRSFKISTLGEKKEKLNKENYR